MSGDGMFLLSDDMVKEAVTMNEAADRLDEIRRGFIAEVEALRDPAWGHGDEIAAIGKKKFDPADLQIRDGLTVLPDAIRQTTESTINSARRLGDADMEGADISHNLLKGMPDGGGFRK